MSTEDYPRAQFEALPLSLHESMLNEDLLDFQAAAGRAAYHAEAMVMQAWLLMLAADLESRPGANSIDLSFEEDTPELKATARLHTDHGVVAWLRPGHTSINLSGNAKFGCTDLNAHRSWFSNAMSDIPSSIRSRGAINDIDSAKSGPSAPFDPQGLRDLSLCLGIPDVAQRNEFKSSMLSRQMGADTAQASASAKPIRRV